MTPVDEATPAAPSLDQHVDRLLEFEPTTLPVLSLYLDLRPDRHGRAADVRPFLEREFKALGRTLAASSPERESFERDVERILAYVEEKIDPSTNALAIFACSGAGDFFDAIPLNMAIEGSRVYLYNQPHLYHLLRLQETFPTYAALVTDANSARIFVFGLACTLDAEEVKGKKVHRVKVGGWSQARYQRRVNNAHQQHAKEAIERLERIVHEEKIQHVILAGEAAIIAVLKEQMPKELSEKMVDAMKIDVKAPEQEILAATLEKMREEESRTGAEKAQRLLELYRGRGLAAAGPEETLEALANGQVDELLISASLEQARPEQEAVDAVIAPEIPDSEGGAESDEPRQASIPDLLVTKARQTHAEVTFLEDPALLESIGGVGAFLRWRA